MNPKWVIRIRKNRKYENWIRKKPCIICKKKSELHHVLHCRNDCYFTVSLCKRCHTSSNTAYHKIEHNEFELINRVDLLSVILTNLREYSGQKAEGTNEEQYEILSKLIHIERK